MMIVMTRLILTSMITVQPGQWPVRRTMEILRKVSREVGIWPHPNLCSRAEMEQESLIILGPVF